MRIRMGRWAMGVALADAGWATLVTLLAFALHVGRLQGVPGGATPVSLVSISAAWLAMLWFGGSYDIRFMSTGAEEYRRIITAGVWFLALIAFASLALNMSVARSLVAVILPALVVGTLLGRRLGRAGLRYRMRRNQTVHRTVVLGDRADAVTVVRHVRQIPHVGFYMVGMYIPCFTTSEAMAPAFFPAIQGPDELVASLRSLDVDTIAVSHTSTFGSAHLRRLSWALEGTGIDLLVAPSVTDVAGPRIVVRPVQGLPLLHIEEPQFRGAKRLLKEGMDRSLALLGLAIALPILALTAIAIRICDGSPIFFRQVRVGRSGTEFVIWKFRTMTIDAEHRHSQLLADASHDGLLFKLPDDPRVTRLGSVLRRYSLDEVPQLLNVIAGSMSLVGPRPQRPSEVALYGDAAKRRLLVKPGMTGLWQVSGRNSLSWEETVQLDLHYVDNWSVTRDLIILARTAWAVVRAPGAY